MLLIYHDGMHSLLGFAIQQRKEFSHGNDYTTNKVSVKSVLLLTKPLSYDIVGKMEFLKKLYVYIPEQIISTCFLAGFFYFIYKGAQGVIQDIPSTKSIFMVILIGTGFGVLKTFTNNTYD